VWENGSIKILKNLQMQFIEVKNE
jgi:hypothetical protein